tara:strand:- start:293 stop:826 length:534 start_codon:yes stop_codon:yes gene_type:complete
MVQKAHPDADTSVGAWVTNDGSSDRFAAINEVTTDDSDFIHVTDDSSGSSFPITLSLSSVTDPSSTDAHSVVVRAVVAGVSGEVNLNVNLKDGGSSIKNETFTLQDSFTNHTMNLSTAQLNSISGYGNLTLVLTSTDDSYSGSFQTKISQAYFTCPDASSSVPIAAIAMNTYRQMGN